MNLIPSPTARLASTRLGHVVAHLPALTCAVCGTIRQHPTTPTQKTCGHFACNSKWGKTRARLYQSGKPYGPLAIKAALLLDKPVAI